MIESCESRDGWLIITREDHSVSLVPFEAVASWAELLGSTDPAEVAEAIEHVSTHGEPDGVWADAYALLAHREHAREAEAQRAVAEGTATDPRSPQLRAAFAAYRAVHQPIGGGECVMDLCRRSVRDKLGIGDPTRKRTVGSRATPAEVGDHDDADTAKLADALRGHEDEIFEATKTFLHSLTDFTDDPLDPHPEPEAPGDEDDPIAALRRKYHPEADS